MGVNVAALRKRKEQMFSSKKHKKRFVPKAASKSFAFVCPPFGDGEWPWDYLGTHSRETEPGAKMRFSIGCQRRTREAR